MLNGVRVIPQSQLTEPLIKRINLLVTFGRLLSDEARGWERNAEEESRYRILVLFLLVLGEQGLDNLSVINVSGIVWIRIGFRHD